MNRGKQSEGGDVPPVAKKPNTGMTKVNDALGYLEKVKKRLELQPTEYNMFLDIMKDFKSQAVDTDGAIKRVKCLFKGNRDLILGFNQFLPPGYKIELEEPPKPTIEFNHAVQYVAKIMAKIKGYKIELGEPPKPTIDFNHAVQYVVKIKLRFRDQPEIYREFLDILHDYQAKKTIDEVYPRLQKLFGAQPDLLDEFKYFLPDNNADTVPPVLHKRRPKDKKMKKTASLVTAVVLAVFVVTVRRVLSQKQNCSAAV